MIKAISDWKLNNKGKKNMALKERIFKNRENVLDVMADNIKGAKQCPHLGGSKCIGGFCKFFVEYFNIDNKGKKVTYYRCDYNQVPVILIEIAGLLRQSIKEQRETQKLLIALHE